MTINAAAIIAGYIVLTPAQAMRALVEYHLLLQAELENAPVCDAAENDNEAAEVLESVTL